MKASLFNVQHAPAGAHATFTLGFPGRSGGLGLELGHPACGNVYVGSDTPDGRLVAFPFFGEGPNDASRYDVERTAPGGQAVGLEALPESAITRSLGPTRDAFSAGDIELTIISPVRQIPDPGKSSAEEVAFAVAPMVLVEIAYDNRRGTTPRRVFFGYEGTDPYAGMRVLDSKGVVGVAQGSLTAIATAEPSAVAACAFTLGNAVNALSEHNRRFLLGNVGAVVATIPAGELKRLRFAVCFYRGGTATTGLRARYLYTRYFDGLEAVANYALAHWDQYLRAAEQPEELVRKSRLSDVQRLMLSHAIQSYYASTQLLELEEPSGVEEASESYRRPGHLYWVVNEGEYRMMNTLDLTVDMIFYELVQNPWVVRNVLDSFAERYHYTDRVRFFGEQATHEGGITFPHDQGARNCFARAGSSSYELEGLRGCFSFMSHEQLCNFICSSGVYVHRSGDEAWRLQRQDLLESCLISLENRDHPDPAQRNGIMKLDTERTQGGSEITTYDSLDQSLGQARGNLYLAVKSWACYVLLAELLRDRPGSRERARAQARRCATTIVQSADRDGKLPALLFDDCPSSLLSAVEGLAYPYLAGCPEAAAPDGEYGALVQALKRHMQGALGRGECRFADGGWRLSSTSENSWLSKIYLAQFVYREILGLPWDEEGHAADRAHLGWLTNAESAYWAYSDQIIRGRAIASRYYPRGVTAALWLEEKAR